VQRHSAEKLIIFSDNVDVLKWLLDKRLGNLSKSGFRRKCERIELNKIRNFGLS